MTSHLVAAFPAFPDLIQVDRAVFERGVQKVLSKWKLSPYRFDALLIAEASLSSAYSSGSSSFPASIATFSEQLPAKSKASM